MTEETITLTTVVGDEGERTELTRRCDEDACSEPELKHGGKVERWNRDIWDWELAGYRFRKTVCSDEWEILEICPA